MSDRSGERDRWLPTPAERAELGRLAASDPEFAGVEDNAAYRLVRLDRAKTRARALRIRAIFGLATCALALAGDFETALLFLAGALLLSFFRFTGIFEADLSFGRVLRAAPELAAIRFPAREAAVGLRAAHAGRFGSGERIAVLGAGACLAAAGLAPVAWADSASVAGAMPGLFAAAALLGCGFAPDASTAGLWLGMHGMRNYRTIRRGFRAGRFDREFFAAHARTIPPTIFVFAVFGILPQAWFRFAARSDSASPRLAAAMLLSGAAAGAAWRIAARRAREFQTRALAREIEILFEIAREERFEPRRAGGATR